MAEEIAVSLYHWDFNRVGPDFDPRFETCSIAIFQWQSKAGGKGLKKVNAARVCGFACDLKGLYAKAREVCDRLNSAKAIVTARPKWLQKQYSVPRPKSLPKRTDGKVSRSSVYSIRERVMKAILSPEGFIRGKDATWIRRRGDQIHVINFQAGRWARDYTVNLGVHYDFLPRLGPPGKAELTEFQDVDCGLRARIGDFMPEDVDRWFDIGASSAAVRRTFEQNARVCLRAFAKASRQFAQPEKMFLKADGTPKKIVSIYGWMIMDRQFLNDLANYRKAQAKTSRRASK